MTDYLSARQSERCTRNALKGAYLGQFLEEIAGVGRSVYVSSVPDDDVRGAAFYSRVKLHACTHRCQQLSSRSFVTPRIYLIVRYTHGGFLYGLGGP